MFPSQKSSMEEIVIAGISGRLPESNNLEEFWENLINGVDMVTEDDRRWKPGKRVPALDSNCCSLIFGYFKRYFLNVFLLTRLWSHIQCHLFDSVNIPYWPLKISSCMLGWLILWKALSHITPSGPSGGNSNSLSGLLPKLSNDQSIMYCYLVLQLQYQKHLARIVKNERDAKGNILTHFYSVCYKVVNRRVLQNGSILIGCWGLGLEDTFLLQFVTAEARWWLSGRCTRHCLRVCRESWCEAADSFPALCVVQQSVLISWWAD